MAWTVRAARPVDAQAVVALVHRFNREDGNPPGGLTAEAFRRLGFGPQARFQTLVADDASRLLGYALFFAAYDTEHGAEGAYLQDLFVLPGARGQGIGRALMAAVARACRADGGCYLFWNALERNQGGRAFYRRIGAREEPVVTLSLQPEALQRLADGG
jgi:GNAT superfamily N-acetyltransferase